MNEYCINTPFTSLCKGAISSSTLADLVKECRLDTFFSLSGDVTFALPHLFFLLSEPLRERGGVGTWGGVTFPIGSGDGASVGINGCWTVFGPGRIG